MSHADRELQPAPVTPAVEVAQSPSEPAPAGALAGLGATIGASVLQRKIARRIARRASEPRGVDANGVAPNAGEAVEKAASTSGSPLPGNLQERFERSLGADLSQVRVHTGAESAAAADAVSAHAYTTGSSIHFAAGQYAPGTPSGDRLLAHEVAHTVQQSGGGSAVQAKAEVSSPGDTLEHEADAAAERMLTGERAHVSLGGGVLARDPVQVSDRVTDGPYGWQSSYQAEVSGSEVRLTVKVKIVPDSGVTEANVTSVQTTTQTEFTRMWDNKFTLVESGTNARFNLRCNLSFVDSGEHLRVALHAGTGRANLSNWYVTPSASITYAHELGHQLGLKDEYVDSRVPDRATATSPGVHTDHSIMGNYHSEGRAEAQAQLRHGQTIAAAISRASGRTFTAAMRTGT